MRTWARLGFTALTALCACSSQSSEVTEPVVTIVPDSAGTSVASAEETGSVPPTSTLPTSSVAPVAQLPIEARFLPIDLRCEKDADCAVTKRGVHEPLFCCDACDAVAGARAWVARADIRCNVYDKEPAHHSCPPRDCGARSGARCNHGACELVP